MKIEEVAGVGHEVKEPGTENFYSDGSSKVNSLNEKNEITCTQMSVEADMYGQCADLKQSEKKKVQTETQEHGENRATLPHPTTSDAADLGKMILAGSTDTVTPPPNRKRMLAANLGAGSHQRRPALEINVNTPERTKKLTKVFYVKIIEEEIRPLNVKNMKGPKEMTYFHSD